MLVFAARFTTRHWFWFSFTTLLFGIHLFTSRFHTQVYDAGGYWDLAKMMYHNGDFSLLHFDSALRGYLLPLLYVPVVALNNWQQVVTDEMLIKLLGALLAGLLFGVQLPKLWQKTTGLEVGPLRRLLFVVAAFLLWRDYFNYTLTDFPAVAGLAGALCLLLPHPTVGRSLLAGALIAGIINIRPVYLVLFPLVLLLGIWLSVRSKEGYSYAAIGRFLLLFLVGFGLICLPQWLINKHSFHTARPLVIGIDLNDPAMVASGDLYLQKITDGFTIQKYETSIAADHPHPQIFYRDPAGIVLLAKDSTGKIDSYSEYISFTLTHPLDVLAINLRHLFNGLDVLYPTPYIFHVYSSTAALAWLNYTLLFVASVCIVRRIQSVKPLQILILGIILLPAFTTIPMPMECRYVLPLHVLLIAIACFGWPAAWSWKALEGRRLSLLLAYVLFISACYMLSASTQMQLDTGAKLLSV
jgi:hypothetical protein